MENKNQPAFPVHDDEGIVETPGLTKREYFAAAALPAIIEATSRGVYNRNNYEHAAKEAVLYADALLEKLK